MPVGGGHQRRYQQLRQPGFAQAVTQEYVLALVFLERLLELKARLRLQRRKNWVLAVVLARNRNIRTPARPQKIRIGEDDGRALV